MRSLLKILFAAFALTIALGASTAYACGCGIYIPREGDANVMQERALLRWDGQQEDIALSLGVLGSSKQAAIILPVPARADVKLANTTLFDQLAEMTKPIEREEVEWVFFPQLGSSAMPPEAAGGAAPPVTVLSRQNVGPFDVANLSATDSNALQTWLNDNGFQLDPQVIALMQPYVEQNWTFVAVRMSPDQSAQTLGGDLQPLWISFASNQLVYPMRASAHAAHPETLVLYVLADHRIDKQNDFGSSRVAYADWVDPSTIADDSALEPFVAHSVQGKLFLTKFIDTVTPAQVNDDFQFATAPQDTPFREVTIIHITRDVSGFVLLACVGIVALAVIAFVVLAIILTRRKRPAAA